MKNLEIWVKYNIMKIVKDFAEIVFLCENTQCMKIEKSKWKYLLMKGDQVRVRERE